MKLYVGNLASQVTEDELERTFAPYGLVRSATVVRERFSGEPRGFGFVEMGTRDEGMAAISGLAGAELQGQRVTINEARPQTDNRRRGGTPGRGRRS